MVGIGNCMETKWKPCGNHMETKMKLTHWIKKSDKKQILDGTFVYDKKEHFMKPSGIWLSVDGSWEDWLKSSGEWGDEWVKSRVCLGAELVSDINLLVINSKEHFLNLFYELTGCKYPKMYGDEILKRYDKIAMFNMRVKERWDDIWIKSGVICRRRLDIDCDYFHLWGCESICVFDRKKVILFEDGD